MIPKEYFTWESIGTLSGASIGIYIVCSSLQAAFNFNPKWLAFILAQILSYVAVFSLPTDISIKEIVLGFINGCLIFCTSSGINAITEKNNKNLHSPDKFGKSIQKIEKRTFRTRWLS